MSRPPRFGRLLYTDRRGAGMAVHGELPDLVRKLMRLRCEARLIADGSEEPIGGVRRVEKGDSDDRRVRWAWWYDATIVDLPAEEHGPTAEFRGIGEPKLP